MTSLAMLVIGIPVVLLGTVLPYLRRLLQSGSGAAGETLGCLIAINTLGAIIGSLAAGFVLLPLLGGQWPPA